MCAILRTCGHACAAPIAAVMPSADWMLVMRKTYLGLGSALSNRKSVHPSVKIVSTPSSSATGPSAGLLPLEITPVKRSILPSSFIRRSSLTFASVPAASSAVMVSILRLPSNPPFALISSAASIWPFNDGSPSTAAALVRNVMCPVLNGVSGIFPLGSAAARTIGEPAIMPAPTTPVPPTATPSAPRNLRRSTVVGLSIGSLQPRWPKRPCCFEASVWDTTTQNVPTRLSRDFRRSTFGDHAAVRKSGYQEAGSLFGERPDWPPHCPPAITLQPRGIARGIQTHITSVP